MDQREDQIHKILTAVDVSYQGNNPLISVAQAGDILEVFGPIVMMLLMIVPKDTAAIWINTIIELQTDRDNIRNDVLTEVVPKHH